MSTERLSINTQGSFSNLQFKNAMVLTLYGQILHICCDFYDIHNF